MACDVMTERSVFAENPKHRRKTVAHTISAIGSLIRSQPKRIARGEVDIVDLGRLAGLRLTLEESIGEMARGLHADGYSWAEIARVLNVTKQEAHRRYGTKKET